MKDIDDIAMVRSGAIIETLWLGIDKGHGPQIWAAEIPGDYYSVETVKPCDSTVH